ncbi:hypothetical protein GJ744_005832 [Endocarpon pusillum]|uniref:Uncharacterized protein n=1 Tax=Endocarpon pusillum TaxID=364733 RepID=A0A8H7A4G6_9EURO|nr:hypothetical protein GJ744_005832 [Endocarpon pusillum]
MKATPKHPALTSLIAFNNTSRVPAAEERGGNIGSLVRRIIFEGPMTSIGKDGVLTSRVSCQVVMCSRIQK